MSGTEADHRILLEQAVFNMKQEKADTAAAAPQPADGGQLSLDVTIELDAYCSPAPRGPDTVSLADASSTVSSDQTPAGGVAQADNPAWGSGQVGRGVWETTGVSLDTAANRVLAACLAEEEKNATLAEEKESGHDKMVLRVEEVAVDLPPCQRVKVERGDGQPVLASDLVVPLQLGDKPCCSSDMKEEGEQQNGLVVMNGPDAAMEEAEESDYDSDDSMEPDLDQIIEDEAFR